VFSSAPHLLPTKEQFIHSEIDPKVGDGEEPVQKVKKILKGISLYFNPGQLVAIMGPSGTIVPVMCV